MAGLTIKAWTVLLLAGVAGALPAAERGRTPPVGILIPGEKHTADPEAAAALVLAGANAERRKAGASDLAENPVLTEAARAFAAFMARTDRYGHGSDGRQPRDRVEQAGYAPCIVAENLAYQYLSTGFATPDLAQSLLEGWLDSPGHRANLLNPDVTETGLGLARSRDTGRYYAVQLFARPQSLQTQFEIHNSSGVAVSYRLGGDDLPLPPGSTVMHRQCRPAAVVFDWPGPQSSLTLAAQSGARYEVVRTSRGEFAVRAAPP